MNFEQKIAIAKFFSAIFSPLIWLPVTVERIVFSLLERGLIRWFEYLALLGIIIIVPIIFFFISVYKKKFDIDLTERRKRFRFYVFSIGCGFLGMYFAYIYSDYLFRLLLVFNFTGLIFMLVTFWDKISLHVGGLTSIFLVYNLRHDWEVYYLLPIIFIVGWSRIVLRKHTLAQVLEGFIVPVLTIPFGFYLFNLR